MFDVGAGALAVLDDVESAAMGPLLRVLREKAARNAMLTAYYDGHRAFKDLGISVPPALRNTRAALGWPAKAVTGLARKHVFEGFTLGGAEDAFDMAGLLSENAFDLELAQGITSAYTHGCAFVTTTRGGGGDPDVVVQARSADATAATWDSRRRQLGSLLAVTGVTDLGAPTSMILMVPGRVVSLSVDPGSLKWLAERQDAPGGRVMAEPLRYDPQLRRPFGRSRITREVRYLTDAAVRTLVRTETSAEFFASPQRYALGVDKDQFTDGARWTAVMGRMLALESNQDGELPALGQFPQISMDPHLSMYRQLAQNFCAETDLPMSRVGLFADNPASAEAMQNAEAHLSEDAEYQWRVFNPALLRVLQNMVMLRDELEDVPDETWSVRPTHQPARYVSPQAAADFTVKAVGAIPKIADTTEALRGLGYGAEQIEGMKSEWRRAGASDLVARLAALRQEPTVDVA